MKFNLIFSFIIISLFGCGKTQPLKENLPAIKTQQAIESCEELKIPRDIAFNGHFLYHLSHCVSNKTKDGQESMPGTLGLLDSLGIAGLDQLTTLLLSNPKPQSINGRPEYPFLRTFLTLAERGVIKDGNLSSELYHERFELLQALSEKLNPYWSLNLILELNETGKLKKYLNILSPLLLEELDTQSLFAMLNQTLTDPKTKDTSIYLVDKILLNDSLYLPLKKLATIDSTYLFPINVQQKCLNTWIDPLPKGAIDDCFEGEKLEQTFKMETSKDRYDRFLSKLSEQEINDLSNLVSDISNNIITMESKERLSLLKKISSGSKGVINIQETPIRNLMGFLEFFAGNKDGFQNVKVSDLDDIMTGLKETIEVTGPDAVKALNQKMGSSKLHYLAEQLMLNGGVIKGCDLNLPALKNVELLEPRKFFDDLSVYLNPNQNCKFGLSPLAVYYFDTINKRIGLESDCSGPDGNFYPESCLGEENFKNIQKKMAQINHDNMVEAEEPEPEVLKELLLTTLNEVKVNLQKDPYYLHWLHFAEGKVSQNLIDFVIEKASSLPNYNLIHVAELDNSLMNHVVTRDVLREDFLENILVKKIEDLKMVQYQFQDLFKKNKKGNDNALRLFSGAYFKGPLEDLLRSNLFTDKIDPSILESFKGDDFRVAELLGRIRLEGILINNSNLTPDDSELDYRLLGDRNRSIEFQYNYNSENSSYVFSRTDFSKTPSQIKDIIGQNYLRFDKILFDNPLNAINVKTSLGDQFDFWVKNVLYTGIKKNSFWSEKFIEPGHLEGLDLKFFKISPYSSDQIRKIALFYSKNFLMADGALPSKENSSFPMVRTERFPNFNLTRLRLPYEDGPWNGHLAYFPDTFLSNDRNQSLDSLKERFNSLWDKSSYDSINWNLLPSDRKKERDINVDGFSPGGLEVVKILSSLDLFTVNRKLKFVPLVGIGKECILPNQESSSCPISFINSINGDSFTNYRDYLFKSYLKTYCPFLTKERFSDSFQQLITKGLNINVSQDSLEKICGENKNLFITLPDALPNWYHERTLSDIIRVGENPQLKKGLEGLGIHLKYYKTFGKFPHDRENFVRGLLNSSGYLPADYLVYYVRETRDHRGYHAIFPGLLNVYQNYLFNLALSEGSQIDIALAHYGSNVLINEDLSKGTAQDFLVNTVIASQKSYGDRDANALELIFEILKNLTPQQLDAISALVAYPQDIESLSNFTGTYSIFLKFLMGQVPSGTFWQKPGSQALKQLLRQETVRAMVDMLKDFNLNEIRRGFKVLHGGIVQNIKTPQEAFKIISGLKDFMKDELLSGNENQKNVEVIELSYRKIFQEIYQNISVEEINFLMDQMVREDLVSFNDQVAKPFYKNNGVLTRFALKNLFNILDIYQSHFKEKAVRGKNDENYFKNLILSIVNPGRGEEANSYLKALSNFLKEKDLGTWKDTFAPLLFKKPLQDIFLNVLKSLSNIKTTDVRKGISETDIILPTSHNTLVYVQKRMNWNKDTALEVIDALDVFKRLSAPNNEIWEKQNELLLNWLTQYEQIK